MCRSRMLCRSRGGRVPHDLGVACEQAKRRLSSAPTTTIQGEGFCEEMTTVT